MGVRMISVTRTSTLGGLANAVTWTTQLGVSLGSDTTYRIWHMSGRTPSRLRGGYS